MDYPACFSIEARSLIQMLLAKSPEKRLGYHRGAEAIKEHTFFDGIDWALVADKRMDPPFVPTDPCPIDTSDVSTIDASHAIEPFGREDFKYRKEQKQLQRLWTVSTLGGLLLLGGFFLDVIDARSCSYPSSSNSSNSSNSNNNSNSSNSSNSNSNSNTLHHYHYHHRRRHRRRRRHRPCSKLRARTRSSQAQRR